MSKNTRAAMIGYCDTLTREGKLLAIIWNGGNDSGWFEMEFDGKTVEDPSELENAIIDLVANHLGYGAFAGPFSTDGRVTYNRVSKCFEGLDTYSESAGNTRECAIEVRVPEALWFDRMELQVEMDEYNDLGSSVRFIIANGPRINAHAHCANRINKTFKKSMERELTAIEDLCSVQEFIVIPFKDFKKEGKERMFLIRQFDYSFEDTEQQDIIIPLTNKRN